MLRCLSPVKLTTAKRRRLRREAVTAFHEKRNVESSSITREELLKRRKLAADIRMVHIDELRPVGLPSFTCFDELSPSWIPSQPVFAPEVCAPKGTLCFVDDATVASTAKAALNGAKLRRANDNRTNDIGTKCESDSNNLAPDCHAEEPVVDDPQHAKCGSCNKCEYARACAPRVEECVCSSIVCVSCNKAGVVCTCTSPSFFLVCCAACGMAEHDVGSLIYCAKCCFYIEACTCDDPLFMELAEPCEEGGGAHSFEINVRWVQPSERACFECQEMVPYPEQEVCQAAECICEELSDSGSPLGDAIVFHSRCLVHLGDGMVCRRCHINGRMPDQDTDLVEEGEEEEEEEKEEEEESVADPSEDREFDS